MKKAFYYLILILIIAIIIPNMVFSQQAENFKPLSLSSGFILNVDFESKNLLESGYIAASLRIKKHEFYVGPVITELSYLRSPKIVFGGIAGYKYYIFKEPANINVFLNYSLQYFQHSGEHYVYTGYYIIKNKWTEDNCINTFGFGFNVFFDKKRKFSLYNTMGYSVYPMRYKESSYSDVYTSWGYINATLGLTIRIGSTKKKSEKIE